MPTLNVAVAGCGEVASSIHLPLLARLPGAELVAIAESDEVRRQAAQQRFPSCSAVADAAELLTLPEVEAVVICLPNALHAATAVAAIEAGKHVYLEKPLATNLSEGERVLRAWQQSGVVGMMGFNYRFNPLCQSLKQQLQTGKIGELVAVRTCFSTPVRCLPEWKKSRERGGGVLLDLAAHHIDLLHFLFEAEAQSVFASLSSQQSEDDTALLQLCLTNGVAVQSFFSLCGRDEDRLEITGEEGVLSIDRYRSWNVEWTPASGRSRKRRSWKHAPHALKKLSSAGREPSYRVALAQFVQAATAGTAVSPDIGDGYRVQAVIEAAEESAREGREVKLSGGIGV